MLPEGPILPLFKLAKKETIVQIKLLQKNTLFQGFHRNQTNDNG